MLAIGVAWVLGTTDIPGARWLEFGFRITAFLPNLTVLVAWIVLFDGYNGVVNQLLQRLPFVSGGQVRRLPTRRWQRSTSSTTPSARPGTIRCDRGLRLLAK